MKNRFSEALDTLKNNNGMIEHQEVEKSFEKDWLITVNASSSGAVSSGGVLTSGTNSQFKQYCALKYYCEEIDLVSAQDSGIKGVCLSDVKIVLKRGQSSLQILNAFQSNLIFDSVKLIQVMQVGQSLQTIASIFFQQCKITHIKSSLEEVEFSFKYGSRSETYSLVDQSGASQGSF